MTKLNLPHQEPIRFAKYVLSKDETTAIVKVEFDSIPTLPMIVESAAQSSAAFGDGCVRDGVLVSLKNVKLLHSPKALDYNVKVVSEHKMGAMTYFSFEFLENDVLIVTGSFIIAVE